MDIKDLLTSAIEHDIETALDCETVTDDEREGDSDDCESRDPSSCLAETQPIGGGSLTASSIQHVCPDPSSPNRGRSPSVLGQHPLDTPQSGQKHRRSASPPPGPPLKKSRHARKHKKQLHQRAEQRERDGHTPRPKTIARNVKAGTSIKTTLDSGALPAARGAYVAKNSSEAGAAKTYLPADLDGMGFVELPWDGLQVMFPHTHLLQH